MDFELDRDTRCEGADGAYDVGLGDGWSVGPALNGGYLAAVLLRALRLEAPADRQPLTLTAHFLAAVSAGPAQVHVEPVRHDRRTWVGQARLLQDGEERVRAIAACGPRGDDAEPAHDDLPAPDLPAPDDCVDPTEGIDLSAVVPIAERVAYRLPADRRGWMGGEPTGRPAAELHMAMADGRPADDLALVVLVDAMPPVALELGVAGWVPTLELTVHLRGTPRPGWLAAHVASRLAAGGLIDEEAVLRDAGGRVVATSRQLARLPSA